MRLEINELHVSYGVSLALGVVGAVAVILLVKTPIIKLIFALSSFVVISLLLVFVKDQSMILLRSTVMKELLHSPTNLKKSILYTFGILASVYWSFRPSMNMPLDLGTVWASFASLSVPSLFAVVCGYFFLCVLPGASIVLNLPRNYELGLLEKMALAITLSYCLSVISGLALISFEVYSPLISILVMWIFVSVIEVVNHFFQTGDCSSRSSRNHAWTIGIDSLAVAFPAIVVVLLSYLFIMGFGPMNGLMAGDVKRYMNMANDIVYSGPFLASNYVWSNIFWWLASSVTELPMLYAYAGLQFYQLVLPISFYFFVRSLFPARWKVAAIATVLLFFACGMNALIMFSSSASLFQSYSGEGTHLILRYIFLHTGSAGVTPLNLITQTFSTALVLFALAFAYKYLSRDQPRSSLVLSALLGCAAFFTHHIGLVPAFLGAIVIFAIFNDSGKRVAMQLLAAIGLLTALLDPISKFMLSNTVVVWLLPLFSGVLNKANYVAFLLTVFAATSISILLIRFLLRKWTIRHSLTKMLTTLGRYAEHHNGSMKLFSWGIGLVVLMAALGIYVSDFGSVSYSRIWFEESYAFPWFFVVFKNYGILLPLAIACIPYLLEEPEKRSSVFLLSLLLSMILMIIGSMAFPYLLSPNLIAVRYSAYLAYPLSVLGAVLLAKVRTSRRTSESRVQAVPKDLDMMRTSRRTSESRVQAVPKDLELVRLLRKAYARRRTMLKIIFFGCLVLALIISVLSRAYSAEFFYLESQIPTITEEDVNTLRWINSNLPSSSRVLVFSESSKSLLTNLARDIQVVSIIHTTLGYSTIPYSWLRDILFHAGSPEIVLDVLSRLNIDFALVRPDDVSELKGRFGDTCLMRLLAAFPTPYRHGNTTIYSVPEHLLFMDANHMVVRTVADIKSKNLEAVFHMFVASEARFTLVECEELERLDPGYTYYFPESAQLPQRILEKLSTYIAEGAHVVFSDPSFASSNELGMSNSLDFIEIPNNEEQESVTSAIEFVDGYSYTFAEIPVQRVNSANPSQKRFANFLSANQMQIPFISNAEIGNGTMTFVYMSPLGSIQNASVYRDLLQHTFKTMQSWLPKDNSLGAPYTLPYDDEIFLYAVPSAFGLVSMKGLHNTILSYNELSISANTTIKSENVIVAAKHVKIQEVLVASPSTQLTLTNTTISDFAVRGSGTASYESASIRTRTTNSNPYVIVEVEVAHSHSLDLSSADVTFKDESQGVSYQFSSVSISLVSKDFLTIVVKQPTLEIDGSISGTLHGLIVHETSFFDIPITSKKIISGDFSLKVLCASGIAYTMLEKIADLIA